MKITLNLSPAATARDRFALAWSIPTTLAALAVLVLLCRASLREYRDNRFIQQQLASVEMRAAALRGQEAGLRRDFEQPASGEVLVRAKFVNNLIDQKQLSLTDLVTRVAGLLPESAHLTGLTLMSPKKPGDDYAVRMGIAATGEEPVQTFINDLEDSADFKNVSIVNEGFQEESAEGGQQVKLICAASYLPGAEEAFEAKNEASKTSGQKATAGRAGAERGTGKMAAGSHKTQAGTQAAGAKNRPGKTRAPGGSRKVEKPSAKKQAASR
jgi:hypothetical protein